MQLRYARRRRGSPLLCWLLVISASSIRSLRAPSHVSRSLPIPQRKSTIETHSSAQLQKGVTYTVHGILTFISRSIGLCLQSLHHCFRDWTKPSATSLLLGSLADLPRSKSELMAENALLRQQLIVLRRHVKRPTFTKTDRLLLVLLARAVRTWKHALLIVQLETLLRWHRQGFRLFWKYKSRAGSPGTAPLGSG